MRKYIFLLMFMTASLYAGNHVDTVVQDFMQRSGVVGMSVAVVKKGKIVFARGYGMANRSTQEKVAPSHQFRIASITKPITAAAIMRLVQEGKIKLEDRVFGDSRHKGILTLDYVRYGKIVPNDHLFDIKVIHLLEHTSGNWYNKKRSVLTNTRYKGLKFIHHVLAKQRRDNFDLFEVGEEYKYSNFGYYILGLIIEEKTNMKYEDYIRNVLLADYPTIDFYPKSKFTNNEVKYYPGKKRLYSNSTVAKLFSAGGVVSSAADLAMFGSQFDTDNFGGINNFGLNKHSVNLIKTPQTQGAKKARYSKGWVIPFSDKRRWWHSGKITATRAMLLCDDKHSRVIPQTCVAILINTEINKSFRRKLAGLARKIGSSVSR